MGRSIVYLCRGHGYAHAARARLILPELRAKAAPYDVELASAGTGVEYFRLYGIPCLDLGIEDADDHTDRAGARLHDHLRARQDCAGVFCDELLLTPRICRVLGIPCVLMTCSFHDYGEKPMVRRVFAEASRILLADWAELHPVPADLLSRTTATGPVMPDITVDREQARSALGLPGEDFVATVAFGSLHPAKANALRPALAAVLRAWTQAPPRSRLVLPFDRVEATGLLDEVPDLPNLTWIGRTDQASAYHRASDVVFTAGTGTTSELVKNAIPTVVVAPPATAPENRQRADYLAGQGVVAIADGTESAAEMWSLVAPAVDRAAQPRADLRWGDPSEIAEIVTGHL